MAKINLFNQKQVDTIYESVIYDFNKEFQDIQKDLESKVEKEIEKVLKKDPKIEEFKTERVEFWDKAVALVEVLKQAKEIEEDIEFSYDSGIGYTSLGFWARDILKNGIDYEKKNYDENTENHLKRKANNIAETNLGLDNLYTKLQLLKDEIKARIATMQVIDYDSVVQLLHELVEVEDFFNI